MNITGHNSYSGCRFCNIRGIYSQKYKHIYFHSAKYEKKDHLSWLAYVNEIGVAESLKEKQVLIKQYGNNSYYFLLL